MFLLLLLKSKYSFNVFVWKLHLLMLIFSIWTIFLMNTLLLHSLSFIIINYILNFIKYHKSLNILRKLVGKQYKLNC